MAKKKSVPFIGPLITVAFCVAAFYVLKNELAQYEASEVLKSFQAIPLTHIGIALAFTFLNYAILVFTDVLALKCIEKPIRFTKTAFVSFIAYVFTYNLGFSVVSSTAVRYRLYSSHGLTSLDIAKIVSFCAMTFFVGTCALGGITLIVGASEFPEKFQDAWASPMLVGIFFLVSLSVYFSILIFCRKPIRLFGKQFQFPHWKYGVGQFIISTSDIVVSAIVLYILIPDTGVSFPVFCGIFLLGLIAGLISSVPGGLGVFESTLLLLLPAGGDPLGVIGALIAFRVIYYLIPLAIASILMIGHEAHQIKLWFGAHRKSLSRKTLQSITRFHAVAIFCAGCLLLLSGATPGIASRLEWLNSTLPLFVLETSHFTASLIGLGLLFAAAAVRRKLDVGYWLAVLFLSLGISVSLLKGLDYEEAIILAVLLAIIIPFRDTFYRRSFSSYNVLTKRWIIATAAILISTTALGYFYASHAAFHHMSWWEFSWNAEAPRIWRATVGILVGAAIISTLQLMRRPKHTFEPPSEADINRAAKIIQTSTSASANLALLKDKHFLFSDSGNSFIMYRIQGPSWIAMGDPVGPKEEVEPMIEKFLHRVDLYGGRPVFYEASANIIPAYKECGFNLFKIGEVARVDLATFSLEGPKRRSLRACYNKLQRKGCTFEVLQPHQIAEHLPRLKEISDDWLHSKNCKEKSFSLGSYSEEYVEKFQVAILRENDRIVAFANLWDSAEKEELCIDIMRYAQDAPGRVMECLMIQSILWGKEQGYHWFNLGVAPLSGFNAGKSAPVWDKIGNFVYTHGERFYNFQGLRNYKNRFNPVWQEIYVATSTRTELPFALTDVSTTISGSLKGVFLK